jgi:hypothetical protein
VATTAIAEEAAAPSKAPHWSWSAIDAAKKAKAAVEAQDDATSAQEDEMEIDELNEDGTYELPADDENSWLGTHCR